MPAPCKRVVVTLVLIVLACAPLAIVTTGAAAMPPSCDSSGVCTLIPLSSSGYRYQVVAQGAGAGFQQPSFDDSGWAVGSAPFGANLSCNVPATTNWPLDTDILVRKHFDVPAGATDLRVHIAIDNDVQVFINGVDISGGLQVHEGCVSPFNNQLDFSAPDSALLTGDNVIAVRGRDRGVDDFLDLQVTVQESGAPLFSDNFESGTLAAWTTVQTNAGGAAIVQKSFAISAPYAARLSATTAAGSYAYARATLSAPHIEFMVSGDFQERAQGAAGSTVPLLRLFDGNGNLVISLYTLNHTNGQLWVQHSGSYHRTTGNLTLQNWGHLSLHVITHGVNDSTVTVQLNGTTIYSVQGASLGVAGVQTLQIGNEAHQQAFDLVADNIVATAP